MAKSKFFRIAVEGTTADGRAIERADIEQMAADYDAATYAARINCEHIRGFSPEPPFNCYGDVLALETREVELTIGGKPEKRLALYAQVEANDQLLALHKKGQKIFTSCEVQTNFAGKGRAYLVGLAVTDSPASLGTEMLKFAAGQGDANPLAHRKLDPSNLFTAANELELELEADEGDKPATLKGLVEVFANIVTKLTGAPTPAPAPAPDPTPAPPAPAPDTPPANDNAELTQLASAVAQLATAVEKSANDNAQAVADLTGRVDGIAAQLDETPANFSRRPLANGGGTAVKTDC